jgi:hypothetical protein
MKLIFLTLIASMLVASCGKSSQKSLDKNTNEMELLEGTVSFIKNILVPSAHARDLNTDLRTDLRTDLTTSNFTTSLSDGSTVQDRADYLDQENQILFNKVDLVNNLTAYSFTSIIDINSDIIERRDDQSPQISISQLLTTLSKYHNVSENLQHKLKTQSMKLDLNYGLVLAYSFNSEQDLIDINIGNINQESKYQVYIPKNSQLDKLDLIKLDDQTSIPLVRAAISNRQDRINKSLNINILDTFDVLNEISSARSEKLVHDSRLANLSYANDININDNNEPDSSLESSAPDRITLENSYHVLKNTHSINLLQVEQAAYLIASKIFSANRTQALMFFRELLELQDPNWINDTMNFKTAISSDDRDQINQYTEDFDNQFNSLKRSINLLSNQEPISRFSTPILQPAE